MFVRLTELRPVTARDTLYRFTCPAIARAALPGQFVELKLTGGCDPFLRRPISLFDADGTETFSLLVRTVGRGTEYMTGWTPGMEIDVLGPLGSGFSWETDTRDCLLVAGGIGLAPMGFLARRLLDEGKRVRLLFSPRRDAALLDALPFRERLDVSCCENRSALPAALDALLAQGAEPALSGEQILLRYPEIYGYPLEAPNPPASSPAPPATQKAASASRREEAVPAPGQSATQKAASASRREEAVPVPPAYLSGEQAKVYAALAAGSQPVDLLCERCELAAGALLAILTQLELFGLVRLLPGGVVEIVRRS